MTFTGGGDVTNGVLPAMSVAYGTAVSGAVSVAAGEVLILQKDGASIIAARRNREIINKVSSTVETYTLSGKLVKTENGRWPDRLSLGVYLVRSPNGQGGYTPKLIFKE